MQVVLNNPEAQRIIREEMDAGHFASEAAVVEAALFKLRSELHDDVDDDTVEAIKRSDEQLARGEAIDFVQFASEFRAKHGIRDQ